MHITNNRVSIRTHLPVEAGGDLGRVEMSGFGLFRKRLQEVHFRITGLRLDAFGSASRRSGQYEKSFLSNYHSNLSLKLKKPIQNNHQILPLSIIINFNVLTSHTDLTNNDQIYIFPITIFMFGTNSICYQRPKAGYKT